MKALACVLEQVEFRIGQLRNAAAHLQLPITGTARGDFA